jgi:energy-coupling factor transporter ATP-binding protein EcfA2
MAIKITNLTVESFRGIKLSRTIDFTKDGKPCCVLVVGDNGSGKSSIVDAIEFVIQKRIQNTESLAVKSKVEVINQFSEKTPLIKILLSDNTEYENSVLIDDEGKRRAKSDGIKYFNRAPFILRRNNILQFWTTPEVKRQVLFFNYNLDDGTKKNSLDDPFLEKTKELESERLEQKRIRREAVAYLKKQKDMPDDIPLNNSQFLPWVRKNLFYGVAFNQVRNPYKYGKRIVFAEDLIKNVESIIACNNKIKKIDDEIGKYKPEGATKTGVLIRTNNIFEELSQAITDTFLKLSTLSNEITKIDLQISKESDASLNFDMTLKNENHVRPEQILSEANLDMLAFVIFLELTKKAVELGQPPVLILDDVFQSIDSGVRLKLINHIVRDLRDWQIIITVHDRLWKEQLTNLFSINNILLNTYEITAWNSKDGITISSEAMSLDMTLLNNIKNGSIIEIISNASILLEKICSKLSIILPISVKRRENDKYTLGDLFPGIYKELKKTTVSEIVSKMQEMLYLRNMLGGHYNEWSLSLTRNEAVEYAECILSFYNSVFCKKCVRWIENIVHGGKCIGRSCRCGNIKIIDKQKESV